MSNIDASLMPSEQWLDQSELHWIIFVWPVFVSIAITFFMLHQHFLFLLNYVGIAIIIYLFADVLIRYMGTAYALSTGRVILQRGLFFRRTWDVPLTRVESVQMQQSLLGKILGYGDIIVNGVGGDQLVFSTIENPQSFRQKILTSIEQLKTTR
ncbi:MAG: hypothetical protein K0S08_1894 [Gammaproteobacteria bacterium]|jgi:uncharacterized membrane protein YdbT with pleckstrin-like domain|nr:hypothetical protein [Gammaproteobacteria bacterium]